MDREKKLTLVGVFLGLFLAAMDQTIVATALPRIVAELGGTHLYAWVATSYLLASTVAVPIFGRLSDLMENRWVLLAAVVIFLIGSVLCGVAPDMLTLVLFRGLQGIGGGALFAVVITTIALLFPPRERGRYQGLFGAVFGISSIIGPWLGGMLTDEFSWRWVFFINMPAGALALYFIVRHMPALKPREAARHRFDYAGAAALVLWSVPLMLAASTAGTVYAWNALPVVGMVLVTAAGLVWFVRVERRSPEPLFDFSLFRERVFRHATVALFFFGGAFLSAVLFLPLFLVEVRGVSATESGLVLTPLTLGVVAGSVVGGRLASRLGRYRALLLFGNVWAIVGFLALYLILNVETPVWQLLVMMVLLGLGLGPAMPLYTLAVQNAVRRERLGTASSATQFFRQIGSALAVALMGAVLAATLRGMVGERSPELRVREAHVRAEAPPLQDAPEDAALVKAAVTEAVRRVYLLSAFLSLVGFLATLGLPDAELKTEDH